MGLVTDFNHDWSKTKMVNDNPNSLAGATQPAANDEPDTARTVFPVRFEKDFMDFRPEEVDDLVAVPKGGSVPAPASELKFSENLPTGLEDVSQDDLLPASETPQNVTPPVGTGI